MGDVVRLSPLQNRDTVALLRALTIAAVNGDLIGLDVEARMKDGRTAKCVSGRLNRPQRAPTGSDDSRV